MEFGLTERMSRSCGVALPSALPDRYLTRESRANRSLHYVQSCGPCKSRSICTTSQPPYRTGIDKTQDRKHQLLHFLLLYVLFDVQYCSTGFFLPALCDARGCDDWYLPWLSCYVIIATRFRSGLGLDHGSNTVTQARLLQPRDDANVKRYDLLHPPSWASIGLHNETTQRWRELCLIGSCFLSQMPDTRGSHSR